MCRYHQFFIGCLVAINLSALGAESPKSPKGNPTRPPKEYAATLSGAYEKAADMIATCNKATLQVQFADKSENVTVNKIDLMSAFMQGQRIYKQKPIGHNLDTINPARLFAAALPDLLKDNAELLKMHFGDRAALSNTINIDAICSKKAQRLAGATVTVHTMTLKDNKPQIKIHSHKCTAL